jgi:hypothetical protein
VQVLAEKLLLHKGIGLVPIGLLFHPLNIDAKKLSFLGDDNRTLLTSKTQQTLPA